MLRLGSTVGAAQMPPPAGPHMLHAVLVLAARLRLVDGVALPQHRAGVGVERRHAAAERAALVLPAAALSFFVQPLHRRRTRARRDTVGAPVIAADGWSSTLRAQSSRPGLRVDARRRWRGRRRRTRRSRWRPALVRTHRQRRAHAACARERPVRAAGLRIQRVDLAVLAGDEQPPAGERRLRARRVDAGVAERPLQLQPRQVGGGEPAGLRVARVGDAVAPAVPARPASRGWSPPATRCSGSRPPAARGAPTRRPVRNSATAFLSSSLSAIACTCMRP